jgi:hypothetical protein
MPWSELIIALCPSTSKQGFLYDYIYSSALPQMNGFPVSAYYGPIGTVQMTDHSLPDIDFQNKNAPQGLRTAPIATAMQPRAFMLISVQFKSFGF